MHLPSKIQIQIEAGISTEQGSPEGYQKRANNRNFSQWHHHLYRYPEPELCNNLPNFMSRNEAQKLLDRVKKLLLPRFRKPSKLFISRSDCLVMYSITISILKMTFSLQEIHEMVLSR